MRPASLNELKQELKSLSQNDLLEICLRLTKYKKENKELLTYLLFEKGNEAGYIKAIKLEMEEQFGEINKINMYFIKKSIRKILRSTNKYIKYSGSKETEVELLLYFCKVFKESGIRIRSSTTLTNLYENQLRKITKTISGLHEDLQYDYGVEVGKLKGEG